MSELYIVGRDKNMLAQYQDELVRAGVDVHVYTDSAHGLELLDKLGGNPNSYLITQLLMPRRNGRGFLGGLQLLKDAADKNVASRVFVAFDQEHEDAKSACIVLGSAGCIDGSKSDVGTMLAPVFERLGIDAAPKSGHDGDFDLVGELRMELGEPADWQREAETSLNSSQNALGILKSLLAQINDPTYQDEIQLVLLRFASEFFGRGALFIHSPSDGLLIGAGAYGTSEKDPGRSIHAVRIPTDAPSVFTRSLREHVGLQTEFDERGINASLAAALGAPVPREVYTAPLRSPRGLEAMLIADNEGTNRPFPELTLLEIFLQQAGAAMERSSLVEKVRSLSRHN